jgi:CubicO group peptidase (beta-lactamase class C family)
MKEAISAYVNQVIQSHRLSGVAVGVVRDAQPYLAAGFGVRSLESGEPITENSLFHLASISKLFVATSVMQLMEKGKLALTDPLEKHLSYLKIENPFDGELTIQHLLSHTSGFPDVTDYHWDAPEEDDEALERYVRSLDIELMFAPGEGFAYSNIAYEVLGDLVAKVSHMPFEDYVKANILDPLEMKTSTHFRKNVPPSLSVIPHASDLTTRVSEIYPYHRAHAPSSTLHSSAAEMNLWAAANLSGEANILLPATLADMWKPRAAVGKPNRPDKRAGLGWFIDAHRGLRTIYHSGQDVGFCTYFILMPEQGIGVTVLCNTSPAPVEEVAFEILDILLGHQPNPIKPPVMTQLGAVYLESGLDGMRARYAELKSKSPQEYDFNMGGFLKVNDALLDEGRNAQAIDILKFALELFPDDAGGYELLARAYFQSGDMEGAMRCAQRSLEIEPNNPFLQQQIGQLGSVE